MTGRIFMFRPGEKLSDRNGVHLGWFIGEITGGDGRIRVKVRTPEDNIVLALPGSVRPVGPRSKGGGGT